MRATELCRKWFLPPRLQENDLESRQALRTVVLALAMLPWAPIFVVIYLLVNARISALTLFAAGWLLLLILRWFRHGASVAAAANAVTGLVFGALVVLSAVTGGVAAPAFRWMPVVPLLGILLGGRTGGLVWTGITLSVQAALMIGLPTGAVPSELNPDTLRVVGMCGDLGIVCCIAIVTWIFDRSERAAQTMLVESRHAAEAATRAKSTFLANMSHELRTPMNGIIGMTDLTLQTQLEPLQRDYLQVVRSSAGSLLRIVDDILDFSKSDAGQLVLEESEFSLPRCIEEAVQIVAPQACAKGLAISLEGSERLAMPVRGDSFRLRQVLINLLSNAVKFTEQGRIVLSAAPVSLRLNSVEVHFEVRDTGIGIPPGKLDSIFGAFVQADTSTTRTHGGTGLGLAICRQIVELMQGRIWVESTENVGSCFQFDVCLRTARPQLDWPTPEVVSAQGTLEQDSGNTQPAITPTTTMSTRSQRILVAEDNPINQRLAEIVLTQAGYTVVLAPDGAEVVRRVMCEDFDIILMDVSMPKMDGYAATQAIRELESVAGNRIPIIALTANSLDEDRQRCLDAGMDGFLVKPLEREALSATLAQFLTEPVAK